MATPELWNERVLNNTRLYLKFHKYWLSEQKGKVLVLFYKNLEKNLRRNLLEIAKFLNVSATDDILDCVLENSEGKFHRKKPIEETDVTYETLTEETRKEVELVYEEVLQLIDQVHKNSSHVKVVM